MLARDGMAVAPWGAAPKAASTGGKDHHQQKLRTEQEWIAGVTALAQLLMQTLPYKALAQSEQEPLPLHGVVLSGPFPVLPNRLLGRRLSTWLLVPEPLDSILAVTRPLLPADSYGCPSSQAPACDLPIVPLATDDPVSMERFCLLLTPEFSLALVLGEAGDGYPKFQFSFEPELIQSLWQQLRDRIAQTRPPLLAELDRVAEQLPMVEPDYRLVTQFSHLLMAGLQQGNLSATAPEPSLVRFAALETSERSPWRPVSAAKRVPPGETFARPMSFISSSPADAVGHSSDTELLKAMAHEIRTPLTTIRTFTRSLLKRQDISEDVAKRLRLIDRECTQQIDRFNLIFRAVELETTQTAKPQSPLSPISLDQLFEERFRCGSNRPVAATSPWK
jgi:signal transduction histidine kinase